LKKIPFQDYPFEKLNKLFQDVEPTDKYDPITLTIGEPQFPTPNLIKESCITNIDTLNKYPKSAGVDALKNAMLEFVKRRFSIELKNDEILSTLGTREVLFNFPQFYLYKKPSPKIAFTNPFYQIYEGAAIICNAKTYYINLKEEKGFKPKIDKRKLKGCDIVILNFPNNPTGATLSLEELQEWVELALKYDFLLINDECYSEIYDDVPPHSILQASIACGNSKFKNILSINSISKRSSAPSLRSGFIAGDAKILKEYLRYRTYIGCAQPEPLQYASATAWADFEHAESIRQLYIENRKIAREILEVDVPSDTFYIWLKVDDDLKFTKKLYKKYNTKVLPGSYLGREGMGRGYVRIALVESAEKTRESLTRVKMCLEEQK